MLNLEALMNPAMLGGQIDVDLWHYASADGRGIRKAIDYMLPHVLGEKT